VCTRTRSFACTFVFACACGEACLLTCVLQIMTVTFWNLRYFMKPIVLCFMLFLPYLVQDGEFMNYNASKIANPDL
jgi:hypothetical protein